LRYKRPIVVSGSILLIAIFLFTNADVKRTTKRFFTGSIDLLKSKSGIEIYTILFQKPQDGCLLITNSTDQSVPYVDCCIWLELNTCPKELKRIVSMHQFETQKYLIKDTLEYDISFGRKPKWWNLILLGDTLLKMTFKRDSKHEQIFFVNRDSTHVFCCDRAE
jgi:hypothetical protein